MNVQVTRSFFPKANKKVLIFATLEFSNALEVRNWRLCKSENGYFVGYPNAAPGKDGKLYRQAIPRTRALQDEILALMIRTHDAMVKTRDNAKIGYVPDAGSSNARAEAQTVTY